MFFAMKRLLLSAEKTGMSQPRAVYLGVEGLETREVPAALTIVNDVFLHQAYLDLVERPIVTSELSQLTTYLNNGHSRTQAAFTIAKNESLEFRRLRVEDLTSQLLHRVPTPQELQARATYLQNGHSEAQLAGWIAGSNEYFVNAGGNYPGFVNALYQDALGRLPGTVEANRAVQRLASGTSRAQIVREVFNSVEYYTPEVNGYYQQILDRPASSNELAVEIDALRHGGDPERRMARLIGLDEYLNHFHMTATTLASSANPSGFGEPVTLTATVAPLYTSVIPISGTVTFSSGTLILGTSPVDASGQASLTTSALSHGTVTITAAFSGDAFFGASSGSLTALVTSAPMISSLTPAAGPLAGGNTVVIAGANFTGATLVSFGATPAASYTVVSSTQITAVAPAGLTGAVNVTVTTPEGSGTAPVAYTYSAAPVLAGLNTSAGPVAGGNIVTLTGTGFTGASQVRFGTSPASSFTVLSDSQISATVPAGTGTVVLAVTTSGGESNGIAYAYSAMPTVGSVNPTAGPLTGGNSVTITGTGFSLASTVLFGTSSATSFTVLSNTQIAAIAPAGSAGLAGVTVVTPGGLATRSGAYTYAAGPQLTAISANQGPTAGGNAITIYGTHFTGVTAVSFGALPAAFFVVNSDSQITVIAPAGAPGSVSVTVNSIVGASQGLSYSFLAAPSVSSVASGNGPLQGGNTVVITGSDFTGATGVAFGTQPVVSFTVISDTQISAIAPAGSAGEVYVSVTSPGGSDAIAAYAYVASPVITGLDVTRGPVAGGNVIHMSGFNFSTATAVMVGGQPASFSVLSDTQLALTVPAGVSGKASVGVATVGGSAILPNAYTYIATPEIVSMSPAQGPTAGGSIVTLTGIGFTTATSLSFGGTPVSFTVISDSILTALVPAGTGAVDVTLTTGGGSTTLATSYTYVSAPAIGTVSPAQGSTGGGTAVTITGTNFTGATAVKFGDTSVAFTVISPTKIVATSPAGNPGLEDISVTTAGGTSVGQGAFSYVSAPIVSSLSATAGPLSGGNTITIQGSGLSTATGVTFGGVSATPTVLDDTHIVVTVPAGMTAGQVAVTITTAGGTVLADSAYRYVGTPSISTVSASRGPTAGGNVVTVFGSSFNSASSVIFGGVVVPFTVLSDTVLTAIAPAGSAGPVDVSVTTAGGSATMTEAYTYVAAPAFVLTPNQGSTGGGAVVTITGTNLSGTTAVLFGGVPATSLTIVSPTKITAVAPAGNAGAVSVSVTTPGGTAVNIGAFHYVASPVISGMSSSAGPLAGGNTITISGVNLGTATVVFFGENSATPTVLNDTTLSVVVPAGAGGWSAPVTVITAGGTVSAESAYTYVDTPTISTLSPAAGPTAGGNVVTISGTSLNSTTSVTFDGQAVAFTVLSDTTLTAVAPAGSAGYVDVVVSNPGGSATLTETYRYVAGPGAGPISPNQGSTGGGTVVTMTGTNLMNASLVMVGGKPAVITANTPTMVVFIAPAGSAGVVDVTIVTPGGTSTHVGGFHYVASPSVDSLSTTTGPLAGGNSITISGDNVGTATSVSFGGNSATPTVIDDSTLSVTVPAGAGAGSMFVSVTTAGGTASFGGAYTYVDVPTITTVGPTAGPQVGGNVVTIMGTSLNMTTAVIFDGVPVAFTVLSDTTLTAVAPPGVAGAVDIVVTNPGGSTTAAGAYTYVMAPGIGPVSPNQGSTGGGTAVTITGTNFSGATVVLFGGVTATSLTVVSPTQVTAVSPAGYGAVDVTIVTLGGSSTNPHAFHYVGAPVVIGLNTTVGPLAGGNTITISGVNLSTATSVSFGSNSATPTVIDDSTLSVTVPAGAWAGSMLVTVITAGGVTVFDGSYTYVDAPTINAVSPAFGPQTGGNVVTIIGASLNMTTAVTFDGVPVAFTVLSDSQLTAVAPPGFGGTVDIVVTNPGGSAMAVAAYTYVNAPGAGPISPNQGSTSGGNTVIMTGVNLMNASSVMVGGRPALITFNAPTMVVFIAPAGSAGVVDVTIATPGGSSTHVGGYHYVASPVVIGLNTTVGPLAGGNTVTISGVNLSTTTSVSFGSNSAVPTVIDDSTLSVTVPAGAWAGSMLVTITTAGGVAVFDGAYTYVDAPTINAVSPSAGPMVGGNVVTITGTNLTMTTAVTFNGIPVAFSVLNGTTLAAVAPPREPGVVDIVVTSPGGSATAVEAYTYITAPAIGAVSPNQGSIGGGTTVTITGTNFANATSVMFDGVAATIVANTPTSVTVITPAGSAGATDVRITTAGGTSTLVGGFFYIAPPTFASLSSSNGPLAGGNTVTLNGSGLSTATSVSFGGIAVTPTVINDSTISVVVPAGVFEGTVDVSVTTAGGLATLQNAYTYVDVPAISLITSNLGPTSGGMAVTIWGTGFTTTSSVTFGGVLAAFTVISSTEIVVYTPAGAAGAVDVVVTTVGGSATAVEGFTYVGAPGI
jgi:hypothetical protein